LNLPVSLVGHIGRWRFHGSPRLDALLAAEPWARGGVTGVIRTVPGYSRELTDALVREVRGSNGGRVDVRFLIVPAELLADGLVVALDRIRRPGAELQPGGLELVERVSDWLTNQPTVILVGPAPCGLGPGILTEARDLHDWTLKKVAERAITALVFDTSAERAGGNPIDLTVGWPVDPTLSSYADGIFHMWRSYLYSRISWETAGDLSRAGSWAEAGFTNLSDEDDDACEGLLNRLAEEEYSRIGKGSANELSEYVVQFLSPIRSRGDLLRRAEGLLPERLVWRPDGSGWPQPVPWAARAMLARGDAAEATPMLRGSLICRPIAREVLGRCLDLEHRERAVCWSHRTKCIPPPDAADRWSGYCNDAGHHARAFYPANCPAEPRDAWSFASFGEFIHAVAPNSPLWSAWHDLRLLRNDVAHGHYLCWKSVTKLLEIEIRPDP
jgi:hypothetical protein